MKLDPTNLEVARIIASHSLRRAEDRGRLDPSKLFGPQASFIQDKSKNKVACCTRRAGKSHGIAYWLSEAALKFPGSIVPYITLTRQNAKNIIWPALREVNETFQLGMEFKENTGDVVFPNKSKIILRGCDTRSEMEKFRGPKYPRCAIDEAQGFPFYLYELIEEVLGPATMDYDGEIAVTGTPGAACAGPFYEMATGLKKGWSVHGWSLLDNPHLPHAAEWLRKYRERKGIDETDPAYMREYRGIWVRNETNLVFRVRDINMVYKVPEADDWEYVLGIDLGFNDPSAFVVIAYSEFLGQAYVVDTYEQTEMLTASIAARIEKFQEQYPISAVVMDSGGYGKSIVEEIRRTYGISAEPAEKTAKASYVEITNSDLMSGKLFFLEAPHTQQLVDELKLLQWDDSKILYNKFEYDDRFADHLADAFLYAYRRCRHHFPDWDSELPTPGTREALEYEADQWEEEEDRLFFEKRDAPWWDSY